MNIAKIRTNNNIFASFAEETLVFPDSDNDRLQNQPLSNEIEKWAWSNQNLNFEVLVSTFLCQKSKRKGSDVENLLFYNLNNKQSMDNLISSAQKIIFQCKDEIGDNWPQNYTNYPYYYFYGLFDQQSYKDYVLYNCNCNVWIKIDLSDIERLKKIKPNDVDEKRRVVESYRENNNPKVGANTKHCLKIKIPDNLIYDIESLKNYVDCIVVYLNAKNIIQHPTGKIVNNRGYNPSDDLLYYCEIEKNNPEPNKIEVCVCPISNNSQVDDKSCCYKRENLKNYPGFEEVN